MPIDNPYYIKENLAQIQEVREIEEKELMMPEQQAKITNYFKERQDLIIKKSKLSPAARSKIIQRHGANYLSERAFNNDIALMEMYGPGWGEWVAKTAIVVGGGFVLGPIPAMVVGGITAGGAKIAESVVDDSDAKKVFGFVADCGTGIATGGVVGAAAQGVGAVAGFNKFAGLGKNCKDCIAAAKHGIKVGGDIEKVISLLKDAGFAANEAQEHVDHVRAGYDYKSWCKVCTA